MGNPNEYLVMISVWALPILLAITLHEAAHGYVANYFGDDTAKRAGRLSLNPIRHIDPFGTVLLPLILLFFSGFVFGYAKPVPVRADRLRDPRIHMVWVALAGPVSNILIALAAAALMHTTGLIPGVMSSWFLQTLTVCVFFNCLIALFNMLPIPPLDGGRVLIGLLPSHLAQRLARVEPAGIVIVLGLFIVVPMFFAIFNLTVSPGNFLVFEPARELALFILNTLGIR